jgi:hypothetical protein
MVAPGMPQPVLMLNYAMYQTTLCQKLEESMASCHQTSAPVTEKATHHVFLHHYVSRACCSSPLWCTASSLNSFRHPVLSSPVRPSSLPPLWLVTVLWHYRQLHTIRLCMITATRVVLLNTMNLAHFILKYLINSLGPPQVEILIFYSNQSRGEAAIIIFQTRWEIMQHFSLYFEYFSATNVVLPYIDM